MSQGQKRLSMAREATAEEEPRAKRIASLLRTEGLDRSVLGAVAETLRHPLANLSQVCREMLLAGLPWSICTAGEQRHITQVVVVGLVGEVVGKVRSQLEQHLEAEAAKVAEAEGKRAELAAAVEEATTYQAEIAKAVHEQQAYLEELTMALGRKRAVLAETQREEKQGEETMEEARAEQKLLETALEDSFSKLKNGGFEELQEAQASSEAVLAITPKLHLDESLATALPSVLAKQDRQGFDAVVMRQFEESLLAKIASLSGELQGMEGPAQKRKEATRDAKADVEAAEAALEEAVAEFAKVQQASVEATANLETQRCVMSGFVPTLAEAASARDAAKEELEQFCDFDLVAFEMLRDRRSCSDGEESTSTPTTSPPEES